MNDYIILGGYGCKNMNVYTDVKNYGALENTDLYASGSSLCMITCELGKLVPKIRTSSFVMGTESIFQIKQYFDSQLCDVRTYMVGEYK